MEIAQKVEYPFIQSLMSMELLGIKIDLEYFLRLNAQSREKLHQISEEIFILANKRFNLNSPQQLASVLFDDLKLKKKKKTKIGYSTSELVLNSLYDSHPIIPKILE